MSTIKHASELTGGSGATLRARERRYCLVSPQRTESGYSEDDVDRIRGPRRAVRDGFLRAHRRRLAHAGPREVGAAWAGGRTSVAGEHLGRSRPRSRGDPHPSEGEPSLREW